MQAHGLAFFKLIADWKLDVAMANMLTLLVAR